MSSSNESAPELAYQLSELITEDSSWVRARNRRLTDILSHLKNPNDSKIAAVLWGRFVAAKSRS